MEIKQPLALRISEILDFPYPTTTDTLVILISSSRTGALCPSEFFYDWQ